MNIPVIISVAPNGSSKTKTDHERLPISPEELAREAKECQNAGATLIHVHVRNQAGKHTLDIEPYRDAIAAIRGAVGRRMLIQVTSEAMGIYFSAQQMRMVEELKPEAVSIAIRELIPQESDESMAQEFLNWALSEKISVQYVLYSAEELARFYSLKERGVIAGERHFLLFVLGRYNTGRQSNPEELQPFIKILQSNNNQADWAMCAFGKSEAECALKAVSMGGHIRLGFENNLYLQNGSLAKNNAELIWQFRKLYSAGDRPVATIEQTRELILPKVLVNQYA